MTPPPPPYHMPAEWMPHAATWLAWPHNRTDWPGKMSVIPWVYGEIVRHLATSEPVRILVNDERSGQRARELLMKVGADLSVVSFYIWPTNRGWMRDYGPIMALSGRGEPVVLDFSFTAWARYPHWQKDDAVAEQAAMTFGLPIVHPLHQGKRVVLEGGAIEVNGAGSLITTTECLLDPKIQVRNRGFRAPDYERIFEAFLGVKQTIWLHAGIAGDDTHGHIDDVCRFVDLQTVVLAQETDAQDPNYAGLLANREPLEAARLANGQKLHIIPLPMPSALFYRGQRLPASYANFYIGNSVVLVPTFNDPNDRTALGILSELFPTRRVIGIHAVDLVVGGGSLHCLTQQALIL